jgi:hypothetical protein
MSSPDDLRTIRVAPREIVDLVTRILRIHGVDPATANATATDVMHCAAVGHGAVEAVLAAVDDGAIASIGPPHRPVHAPHDALASAYRHGIEMPEDRLAALERAAAGFLVAEAVLDAIADEPTVD